MRKATPPARLRFRHARAFTLVEASVVLIILAMLAALILGAVHLALRTSRESAERQAVVALRTGVEQFKQQFGFLPPLVDDANPLQATGNVYRVRLAGEGSSGPDLKRVQLFLAREVDPNQPRYSELTLAIYLVGVCDKSVDGADSFGFTAPQRDGSFTHRGRTFEPMFEGGRDKKRLVAAGTRGEQARVMDAFGQGRPIRYYRWLPKFHDTGVNKGEVESYNVPPAVGDPLKDSRLRDAEFAIVSGGPDGLINDSNPDAPENADNVVEVGR